MRGLWFGLRCEKVTGLQGRLWFISHLVDAGPCVVARVEHTVVLVELTQQAAGAGGTGADETCHLVVTRATVHTRLVATVINVILTVHALESGTVFTINK